jgi:hypothetical protein
MFDAPDVIEDPLMMLIAPDCVLAPPVLKLMPPEEMPPFPVLINIDPVEPVEDVPVRIDTFPDDLEAERPLRIFTFPPM